MKPDKKFSNLDLEFWANVKLLNQRLGYTKRRTKNSPEGGFNIPSIKEIKNVFQTEGLEYTKLIQGNTLTMFGRLLIDYMTYRAALLTNYVEPNLMTKEEAKEVFYSRLVQD